MVWPLLSITSTLICLTGGRIGILGFLARFLGRVEPAHLTPLLNLQPVPLLLLLLLLLFHHHLLLLLLRGKSSFGVLLLQRDRRRRIPPLAVFYLIFIFISSLSLSLSSFFFVAVTGWNFPLTSINDCVTSNLATLLEKRRKTVLSRRVVLIINIDS